MRFSGSPVTPNLHIQDCRFEGSLVGTNPVSVTVTVPFLNCQFLLSGSQMLNSSGR